ncbi:hypothetical protein BDV95DRAFT_235032 [Massariosphaeria phaeospora]|uniref:Transcriptional regulator n=1 Tax=Massariosphaeria phaeospora TaxID=100035 RepID=A0A7C8IDB7_9PLEO|nr:hypothetical protein BDV95DRAFT_235032 [Massariosphaeria phaeospora]
MSDPETGHQPSDATISRALRDSVVRVYQSGRTDELTVKRVRAKVEEELGLRAGFFKTTEGWKQKSNDLIHEAVESYGVDETTPEPPVVAANDPKPKPAPKKTRIPRENTRGTKRKAATQAKKPTKRKKVVVESDAESEPALSEPPGQNNTVLSDAGNDEPPQQAGRRQRKPVTDDTDEEDVAQKSIVKRDVDTKMESDVDSEGAVPVKAPVAAPSDVKGEVSESELSSLIDEPPAKKKRQKKSPTRKSEPKAASTSRAKAKSKGDEDPDQAEIRRLQGWLVKCGIRKVWSKELAQCASSKDKTKHLKAMLKDVGMEGKYSNEKAADIKEQREFAKDLDAIQEGALAWGKVENEEEAGRPRRRLQRKAKAVVVEHDGANDTDEAGSDVNKDGTESVVGSDNDDAATHESEDDDDVGSDDSE